MILFMWQDVMIGVVQVIDRCLKRFFYVHHACDDDDLALCSSL